MINYRRDKIFANCPVIIYVVNKVYSCLPKSCHGMWSSLIGSAKMNYFKLNTRLGSKSSNNTFIIVTAAVLSCVFVIAVSHFSSTTRSGSLKLRANGSSQAAVLHRKSSDPVLSTGQGQLLGKVLESRAGRKYFAFYDIPYAKPPVGQLRFKVRLQRYLYFVTISSTCY